MFADYYKISHKYISKHGSLLFLYYHHHDHHIEICQSDIYLDK